MLAMPSESVRPRRLPESMMTLGAPAAAAASINSCVRAMISLCRLLSFTPSASLLEPGTMLGTMPYFFRMGNRSGPCRSNALIPISARVPALRLEVQVGPPEDAGADPLFQTSIGRSRGRRQARRRRSAHKCSAFHAHDNINSSMGFAVWMSKEEVWAQGTHEYRPMGCAVIAKTGQLSA